MLACVAVAASANDRDKAKRIHDRIAGVPPTRSDARPDGRRWSPPATRSARPTSPPRAPSFYNVTLKNLAVPWTNRDQTVFAPLNDYIATFIGMVRDDVPFNTALSADLIYTVSGATPAASATSNAHYENAETNNDQPVHRAARRPTQSSIQGIPPAATAGFITSRAASEAFFIDGTNRAMFRFTMMNHMCRDMEQVHDTSLPPDRIRQDVSRSPGGDSRIFLNNCIGCHSGMDPFAQAFAYYDFDNGTRGSPGHDAPGLRLDRRAFEVLQQRHELRARASSLPMTRGRTAGAAARTRCSDGARRPAGATAPSPWARSSPTATHSPSARSRRCSRRCASARRVRSTNRNPQGRRGSHKVEELTTNFMSQRLPVETGFRRNRCVLHGRVRKHT